ncbi:MAG TPA: hypothetical protein VED45_11590 [Steroidobacteraceae bacterium]|nr:hypothetical protein [Steroidobacteraceae bacterium]
MNSSNSRSIADSPFMVGVSGHRDLDPADLPRLRDAVTSFVRQLKKHLPDTELRLTVGMAEGADLLVAETAVALGVTVEAVLPMSIDHYAADFDAETLAHLRTLLHHPHVRCVELAAPAGERAEPHSSAQREAMYANLTATLVRRSSLLLALWDGRVSQLPGGTADTVLRFLGIRTDEHPGPDTLEFIETHDEDDHIERLVYWMPTPRSGSPVDPREPCYLKASGDSALKVEHSLPAPLMRQLAELNAYNLEYRQLSDAGRLPSRASLMSGLAQSPPPGDRPLLEEIDAQYGKADTLAVYYQRRSDRLFHLFGVMAFTMGVAYLLYEQVTESRLVLVAYVLVLLTSLFVYYVLQGKRWFGKHLAYRALAETLRAKFYLRLAGADQSVDATEVLSLSRIDRFRGFGWITFVLNGIEPAEAPSGPVCRLDALEPGGVGQAWIDNQYAYFVRRVARLEKASRRVKIFRQGLLIAILASISVLFLFGRALHHIDMGLGVPLTNMLTFSIGLLAVLLGVWELHQDKMATRELLWQYRNQLNHFARAKAQLARMIVPERRNQLLAELGKDSLMESYLWAIHRYHREHEPPAAGG